MNWFTNISFFLPNWAWIAVALVIAALIIFIIAFCIRAKSKQNPDVEESSADGEWTESADADISDADGLDGDGNDLDENAAEPSEDNSVDGGEDEEDDEVNAVQAEVSSSAEGSSEKKPLNKVYHISKRKTDNMWQVKAAKGAKAIKLFQTQAKAIEYAKKLAENQEARIVIHKEDGSFRNLTYKNKR